MPPGLTAIMLHMPRKAESFSSLSRMFRNDMHLLENMQQGIYFNRATNAFKS